MYGDSFLLERWRHKFLAWRVGTVLIGDRVGNFPRISGPSGHPLIKSCFLWTARLGLVGETGFFFFPYFFFSKSFFFHDVCYIQVNMKGRFFFATRRTGNYFSPKEALDSQEDWM